MAVRRNRQVDLTARRLDSPKPPTIIGEVIDIILYRNSTEGLGFNIRGGYDMPHLPGDDGVFVTKIRQNGAAYKDGRLSEGDKILKINGKSMEDVSHRAAVEMFKTAGNVVNLRVLKDAEKKFVEAQTKGAHVIVSNNNSKEKFIIGLGVSFLVGFAAYRWRDSLKSFFHQLLPSRQEGMYGLSYRPYKY